MQKSTKRNIFIAATYAGTLILGLIFGINYTDLEGNKPGKSLVPIGFSDNSYKIQQIIDLISASYVDSLDMDSIQNGAINHIISHLDPYSSYLLPNESLAQTEALEGTFEGIGMEYYNLRDTLLVIGLISNGPAEKAGFKVGDRILKISNRKLAGLPISKEEIEKLIRGRRGSEVTVQVKRENVPIPIELRPIRDQISVSSIDVAYMIQPTIAFVKIRRFGLRTAEDFQTVLKDLKKQGAQHLILDLRDNGGGYFHVAVRLASEFFNDKRLLVYTEGAHEVKREYFSDAMGQYVNGSLAILINENTASASEIVAGAVQDWDRGTIIGRRSYGKGIVQEQIDFSDGSIINLSIARYYTPIGRSIQRKYSANWSNMIDYPTMYNGLWALDTTYSHGQAFRTLKGRDVFSGGGIVPDIKVDVDSNATSLLYQEISKSSFIEEFVYERFTKKLPAYSIENFLQGYNLPIEEYNIFIQNLRQKGMVISPQKQINLHDLIESDIEAIVGRYYFGREAFFKVKNRDDKCVLRAISLFNPDQS